MDKQTTSALKDTARQHAERDDVRAGIPLLATMLAAGVAGAYAARSVVSGGWVEWVAMIGVFAVTAHATGVLYSMVYRRLRPLGDSDEH